MDDLYARPSAQDAGVRALLDEIGGGDRARDVGGTMSLNLHVEPEDIVLRVHPRFVTRERVDALRRLRERLADRGLLVGRPQPIGGRDVTEVDGRIAEAESYVAHTQPAATWDSYLWMYRAMGRLHAALADHGGPLPDPVVATYGVPPLMRQAAARTAAAVEGDAEAAALVQWVERLLGELEAQWTDPARLPTHVVHGDVRLGNVALAADRASEAAYFDFGFAAARPRAHDLAYSLSWMVLKPDDSGRGEDFDWDSVAELVAAYEEGGGGPLTPVEREAIGPLLSAVPLYLASVAWATPDPAAQLRGEVPFLRIAAWVLSNRPTAGHGAAPSVG